MDEVNALKNGDTNTLVGAIFPLEEFQIHDVEIFSPEFISETEGNADDPPSFGKVSSNIENLRNSEFDDLQTSVEIISKNADGDIIADCNPIPNDKATPEINGSPHVEHTKDLSSMCYQDDAVMRENLLVQDDP
ncbi:hypothetical protein JTB14_022419 [Gonioctena quinquepunctata]|nr:hypothetical protein JTB14_022419 [Gonioctena quinquepunctata]